MVIPIDSFLITFYLRREGRFGASLTEIPNRLRRAGDVEFSPLFSGLARHLLIAA